VLSETLSAALSETLKSEKNRKKGYRLQALAVIAPCIRAHTKSG
jgi:hypothetical protein